MRQCHRARVRVRTAARSVPGGESESFQGSLTVFDYDRFFKHIVVKCKKGCRNTMLSLQSCCFANTLPFAAVSGQNEALLESSLSLLLGASYATVAWKMTFLMFIDYFVDSAICYCDIYSVTQSWDLSLWCALTPSHQLPPHPRVPKQKLH